MSSERDTIYVIGQVRWQLEWVSYIFSKRHELWSTNDFKLDRHFLPTLRKLCILIHCQATQTEIRKGTQPNFAKRYMINGANNLP